MEQPDRIGRYELNHRVGRRALEVSELPSGGHSKQNDFGLRIADWGLNKVIRNPKSAIRNWNYRGGSSRSIRTGVSPNSAYR